MRKIEKTGCVCTSSGWCERHSCTKSHHQWLKCKTSVKYFNMWEKSKDKRKRNLERRNQKYVPQERIKTGVGRTIKRWLSKVGIRASMHCNCFHLANEMDVKGAAYVEKHLDEYVRKMEASIHSWRKGKTLIPQPPRWAIEKLIKWAIASVRKETKEEFTDIQV